MARHAVSIKGAVEANHWQLLDDGLRDDQPIKWIAMMKGERG